MPALLRVWCPSGLTLCSLAKALMASSGDPIWIRHIRLSPLLQSCTSTTVNPFSTMYWRILSVLQISLQSKEQIFTRYEKEITYVKFSGKLATCSICEGEDKLLVSLTAIVWFLKRCTYRKLVKSTKLEAGNSSSLSLEGCRSSWILEKLTQMVLPLIFTWSRNCLQRAAWWGFDICTKAQSGLLWRIFTL